MNERLLNVNWWLKYREAPKHLRIADSEPQCQLIISGWNSMLTPTSLDILRTRLCVPGIWRYCSSFLFKAVYLDFCHNCSSFLCRNYSVSEMGSISVFGWTGYEDVPTLLGPVDGVSLESYSLIPSVSFNKGQFNPFLIHFGGTELVPLPFSFIIFDLFLFFFLYRIYEWHW
jgi:hypothetical protein